MVNLNFNISGQKITRNDSVELVSNSQNYVYATFTFASDWDEYRKSVYFKALSNTKIYEITLEEDNKVKIPTACLKECNFFIWCKGINEEGQILVPTNMLLVKLKLGGTVEDGEEDTSFVWVAEAIKSISSNSISYRKENNIAYLEVDGDTYKADEITLTKEKNIFKIKDSWKNPILESIKTIQEDYLTSADKEEIETNFNQKLSILENKTVSRRLSLFDDLPDEADNKKSYLYIDNDGKDSKLSLFSFKKKISASTIKTEADESKLEAGDYVFSEII